MSFLFATLLCTLNVIAAAAKVSRSPKVMENFIALRVPLHWLRRLAAVQILGVVGVALGMRWPLIGIASALGFVAYFLGAVAIVFKANPRHVLPPLLGLLLAIASTALFAGQT
jgi:DoxX-like family